MAEIMGQSELKMSVALFGGRFGRQVKLAPGQTRPENDDDIAFNPISGFLERGRYWTTQEERDAQIEADRQRFLTNVRSFNAGWVMHLANPRYRRWYWHHWRDEWNWIFRHGWYEPSGFVEFGEPNA